MRFANDIGVFELDSMPSNVQVCVMHAFFVYQHKRGQGLALELHKTALKEMDKLGYDFAICTVTGDNPAQSKAIAKAGWTRSDTFKNTRLNTFTEVWVYDLAIERNALGIAA